MAKKRASMREGPLADLFRSTDESVRDEEITVTATNDAGSGAEVALAEAEQITVERTEPANEPSVTEPSVTEQHPVEETPVQEALVQEPPVEEPPAKVPPAEKPPAADPPAEPATGEIMLEPHKDPAVEEIDRQQTRGLRVNEEVKVEHEGLERLMGGGDPDVRPAYGRDEPDTSSSQPVVPRTHEAVLRVVGVGGAGVNAVNRMVEAQLPGVEFVAINTDLQSLQSSNADVTMHIGSELTRGLGSGSDPRVGYRAAFEEQDKIKTLLKGSDMVFLAAGAGGGTGEEAGAARNGRRSAGGRV